MDTDILIPPFRFAAVEEGLYRGAYPTRKNLSFLDTLGLRTIVSLTPEEPSADLARYCRDRGVRSVYMRVDRPAEKDSVALDDETLARILRLLIDTGSSHPLLIHCLDGQATTGVSLMLLRRLQH